MFESKKSTSAYAKTSWFSAQRMYYSKSTSSRIQLKFRKKFIQEWHRARYFLATRRFSLARALKKRNAMVTCYDTRHDTRTKGSQGWLPAPTDKLLTRILTDWAKHYYFPTRFLYTFFPAKFFPVIQNNCRFSRHFLPTNDLTHWWTLHPNKFFHHSFRIMIFSRHSIHTEKLSRS